MALPLVCKRIPAESKSVQLLPPIGRQFSFLVKLENKDNLFNLKFDNKIIDDFKKYGQTFDDLKIGFNGPYNYEEKWVLIYIENKLPRRNKELKEAEGIIVSAYQNYLEDQWLSNLKEKHKISINFETLYSIKQKP